VADLVTTRTPEVVIERDETSLFGEATATFSPCLTWRYNLTRRWADGPLLRFIMLNPSTATAFVLDPTVNRCVGRARAMGYAGLLVQNIFALRSTDPKGLKVHPEPIGALNDAYLRDPGEEVGQTIVAWGTHAKFMNRGAQVMQMLADSGQDLLCLAVTKDGYPGHPLYIAASQQPMPYPASE
jgi:hypothetical protein